MLPFGVRIIVIRRRHQMLEAGIELPLNMQSGGRDTCDVFMAFFPSLDMFLVYMRHSRAAVRIEGWKLLEQ
jgi:hypothetical protein